MATGQAHATIGIVLQDDQNRLFGLSNRHVTLHSDGLIYTSQMQVFGKRCVPTNSFSYKHDVDVFEILDVFKPDNCSMLHQENEMTSKCNISNRELDEFYDHCVLKYKNTNNITEVSETGFVLSKARHDQELSKFINDPTVEFFVAGNDGVKFAEKSDSGTVIAVINERDEFEFMGIIQGGDSDETEISSYTRCLFLPRMLSYLEKVYETSFRLFVYQPIKCTIQFGDPILIRSPDQIALEDFDLCDKLIQLFNCFGLDKEDKKLLDFVREQEEKLSVKLNDRLNVETKDDNSPEQGSVTNSVLACHFVYGGQFKESEKCFKMACRHISKSKWFKFRIVFNMITYVLFLYCNNGDSVNHWKLLQNVRQTLDDDKEEEEKMIDSPGFPIERLGYVPYEFARYHRKNNNRCEAMLESDKAIVMFQKAFESRRSDDTANRLALCICESIDATLWVGKTTVEEISNVDISTVKKKVDMVEGLIKEYSVSSVQYVDFLLCQSDLEYRRNNIIESICHAQKAFDISTEKRIRSSASQAEKRIMLLKNLQ